MSYRQVHMSSETTELESKALELLPQVRGYGKYSRIYRAALRILVKAVEEDSKLIKDHTIWE